ncbi:hypothetical protein QUA71_25765, partial [Microcoleus sp. MON1_C5]|uniref:hypothetical protein n=1 Tax=Microcoleus sp. MON1_C5 TaxID=2818828 RepID=UPI002FD06419
MSEGFFYTMGNLQLVIGNESLPQLPQYNGSGAWAIGTIDKSFQQRRHIPKKKPPEIPGGFFFIRA